MYIDLINFASIPTIYITRGRSTEAPAYYSDDDDASGFSSRAAYALGMDKPRYPMPATASRRIGEPDR